MTPAAKAKARVVAATMAAEAAPRATARVAAARAAPRVVVATRRRRWRAEVIDGTLDRPQRHVDLLATPTCRFPPWAFHRFVNIYRGSRERTPRRHFRVVSHTSRQHARVHAHQVVEHVRATVAHRIHQQIISAPWHGRMWVNDSGGSGEESHISMTRARPPPRHR